MYPSAKNSRSLLFLIALQVLLLLVALVPAHARGSRGGYRGGDVSVHGHYRRDGTYVQPHMRSALAGILLRESRSYPAGIDEDAGTEEQVARYPNAGSANKAPRLFSEPYLLYGGRVPVLNTKDWPELAYG